MDLVKAFENKLTLPKSDYGNDGEKEQKEVEVEEEQTERDLKWEYSSSFCASDLLLTVENLGLTGPRVSSSLDSNHGRTSSGGRQTRRNSSESTSSFGGRRWKRMVRVTTQQPFKLRTETTLVNMIKKIMPSLSLSTEDFPENVMVNILSRLPIKTIIHSKFVCKKWRNLVMDSYFDNIHFSSSPTCLMIHHHERDETSDSEEDMISKKPGSLDWLETTGEICELGFYGYRDSIKIFDLNLAPIFNNSKIVPVCSANGLICLQQFHDETEDTCICNPITREYMILPRQQKFAKVPKSRNIVYGFGVGLETKEYKVIQIFQGNIQPNPSSAEVYTLGTGKWRSLGQAPYWLNGFHCPFLNGCVHWIVLEKDSPEKLCSFDFDNEIFELFPSPPVELIKESRGHCQGLGVLKGCLFQSDLFYDIEFTIWVMKEYKELVIKLSYASRQMGWMENPTYVIEGLKDGTILLVDNYEGVLVYSLQSEKVDQGYPLRSGFTGIAYRPSFLKLQNFESETFYVL